MKSPLQMLTNSVLVMGEFSKDPGFHPSIFFSLVVLLNMPLMMT